MPTIAICDDEQDQLQLLHAQTERFVSALSDLHAPLAAVPRGTIQIRDFSDPLSFIDDIEANGCPDIALLDICMPEFSDVQIAQHIRTKSSDTRIIFLTTSPEYAIDAFALKAAHYLVKPFTQKQFDEAMNRCASVFKAPPKQISLHGESESVTMLDISEIYYIESMGHRRYVHTAHSEHAETQRTLTQFAEELERLSPGQFITPYRGYIVNLAAVRTITASNLVLKDGSKVLIKAGDFRALKEKLFAYMFH